MSSRNEFEKIATLKGHLRSVSSVKFAPDGNTLASSGADAKVNNKHAFECIIFCVVS